MLRYLFFFVFELVFMILEGFSWWVGYGAVWYFGTQYERKKLEIKNIGYEDIFSIYLKKLIKIINCYSLLCNRRNIYNPLSKLSDYESSNVF
jgi:hypothetical protein